MPDAFGLVGGALNASYDDRQKQNHAEYQVKTAIRQFVPPIILVVGTFGNVMAIIIMRRKEFRSRSSAMPVLMTALAVCDTVLLYTGLLGIWIGAVSGVDFRMEHFLLCKIHTWIVYATFYTDAWILVAMTIERMTSVLKPLKVHATFTRRRGHSIVVGTALFFFAISAHILFGRDVRVNKRGTTRCMAWDEDYKNFFLGAWVWFDLMMHCLLPGIVLITGNAVIIWKVKASTRVSVALGNTRPIHRRRISFLSEAFLLLSLVFLLTTLPISVMNIMEPYLRQLPKDPQTKAVLELAWTVTGIMEYINNAVNFYMFCLSGSVFRREAKAVLTCKAEPETPITASAQRCTKTYSGRLNRSSTQLSNPL
ncbi:hypothetical protein BaRGS_00007303 [Batillaria attramentaria]|uniref:G-protein coupled receptors family 1 profile domain-containing protein n=1 Tax=Batillaria attramentaria TaxID=370345 RepID=A0ABD0LPA3_9CAEN